MDTITAIILAIVEGITEFIPVSSTGHMILTTKLLGFDEQEPIMKTYEIVIQLGAILAIALVYRRRVLDLLGIGRQSRGRGGVMPAPRLNLIHIILGIAPALAVAFLQGILLKAFLEPLQYSGRLSPGDTDDCGRVVEQAQIAGNCA